ncbi:hypothetical protein L7F22_066361 [Adiantum nelumboides]|nr:hypothetical protein [Adiantum nelumboides]
MEASFNALSTRLMHQEHFSRLYHGGSPGVPLRADPARNFRAETAVGIGDGQGYGALDSFLAGSVREFNSGNSAVLPSVKKSDGFVDEGQRFVNGSSHIANTINTSPRVLDWAGNEQPGEMGSEAEYRELEDGDGGSSGGSQSDRSDEEDEDDGDIDGEGEDIESQQDVTRLVDHRLSGQRNCEALGSTQGKCTEATRQELVAGPQSSESLQKSNFDRDLSSHASTSSAVPVSMFLSSSSTIPFLSSFSSPPSAGPILGHTDNNPAAPNGTLVVASGLGASHSSHGYFKDNIEKEASLKDGYDKEKSNYNNEQSRTAHSSPVPEAVPIRSATAQCFSSLVQATSVNSQKDQTNQIVTFSQRKHHEPMEMPLRSALTDPLTGALMDDATILLCGHSFGSESLQRVLENNACISCGAAARREDMAPNHALQLVVQAYRQEERRWKENASRAAKRRRERLEQDRQSMGELTPIDFSRHKGVQFPYKVNDKVLIKGNKRTPDRFVGRNAIITTQCLNGWYVVRTLDNGESVKLQYRSLTKTEEQESQPNVTAPNWL